MARDPAKLRPQMVPANAHVQNCNALTINGIVRGQKISRHGNREHDNRKKGKINALKTQANNNRGAENDDHKRCRFYRRFTAQRMGSPCDGLHAKVHPEISCRFCESANRPFVYSLIRLMLKTEK